MTTNIKRICLMICYFICILLVNKNIYFFIAEGLVSAFYVGLFTAGITITFALTVIYVTLDKMIRENDKK